MKAEYGILSFLPRASDLLRGGCEEPRHSTGALTLLEIRQQGSTTIPVVPFFAGEQGAWLDAALLYGINKRRDGTASFSFLSKNTSPMKSHFPNFLSIARLFSYGRPSLYTLHPAHCLLMFLGYRVPIAMRGLK